MAVTAAGFALCHQAIDRRGASSRRSELRDLRPAVGDDEGLALPRSLRVTTQVLPHLSYADTFHVRHCSALSANPFDALNAYKLGVSRRAALSSARPEPD